MDIHCSISICNAFFISHVCKCAVHLWNDRDLNAHVHDPKRQWCKFRCQTQLPKGPSSLNCDLCQRQTNSYNNKIVVTILNHLCWLYHLDLRRWAREIDGILLIALLVNFTEVKRVVYLDGASPGSHQRQLEFQNNLNGKRSNAYHICQNTIIDTDILNIT